MPALLMGLKGRMEDDGVLYVEALGFSCRSSSVSLALVEKDFN